MEQVREEARRERQNVLNSIREEVERLTVEQREAIAAQTEEARAALGSDALRLGREIGERILHRPISDAATTGLGSPA